VSGWQERPLGEVCEIYQPESLSKKDLPPSAPYPVYGANGQIGWYDRFNHGQSEVVLGCRGSCGAINVTPPCSWITSNAMVIAPKSEILSRALLRYLMEALDLSEVISGVAQPQITRASLAPVLIRFPSSPSEQQHLVAILDEALGAIRVAIANAEIGVQRAFELRRSVIRSRLAEASSARKVVTLGDVCDLYQPRTISSSEMVADGEYPVFGANGQIGRYHSFNHEEPQLLVTCRGATCGSVNMSIEKSWVTGNSMVVKPRSDCLSLRYMRYYLQYAFDFGPTITGSAQPQITRQSLAPSIISYPESVSAQEDLADFMEQIVAETSDLAGLQNRKLAALAELKQSLLARAFSGELTREPMAA
jgi:type I restriction enzyme S subunit